MSDALTQTVSGDRTTTAVATGNKLAAAFEMGYSCPMLRYSHFYASKFPDTQDCWLGVHVSVENLNNAIRLLVDELVADAVPALREAMMEALTAHHRRREATDFRRSNRVLAAALSAEERSWERLSLCAPNTLSDRSFYKPFYYFGKALGECLLNLIEDYTRQWGLIIALADAAHRLDPKVTGQCPTLLRLIKQRNDYSGNEISEFLAIVLGEVPLSTNPDYYGWPDVIGRLETLHRQSRQELAAIGNLEMIMPLTAGGNLDEQEPTYLGLILNPDKCVVRRGDAEVSIQRYNVWRLVKFFTQQRDNLATMRRIQERWQEAETDVLPSKETVYATISDLKQQLKPLMVTIENKPKLGYRLVDCR